MSEGRGQGAGSAMMTTATALVERMERALRFYRWAFIALAIVVALLGRVVWQQYQDQRAACASGNAFRAADMANWDDFITIALGPRPKAGALEAAASLRGKIHHRDAPRACPGLLRLLP